MGYQNIIRQGKKDDSTKEKLQELHKQKEHSSTFEPNTIHIIEEPGYSNLYNEAYNELCNYVRKLKQYCFERMSILSTYINRDSDKIHKVIFK